MPDAAARGRRRLAGWTMGCAGLAAALGATLLAPPRPRFVWNVSASAPVGLYLVSDVTALARGDTVIVRLPDRLRSLAARRRYLPGNVPLVKRVAAVAGDEVCAVGARVAVNERLVVARLERDAAGRPMPWWSGCIRLEPGEYLLLMTDSPASFDGRYFGVTSADDIVGRAQFLWPA